MKRSSSLLLSLALSATATAALATPAHAVDDGTYVIRDTATGQCLTPASLLNGAPAVLGACTRWRAQSELPNSATLFDLTSRERDPRCLDRDLQGNVIVYACVFPQQWDIPVSSGGPTRIRNIETKRCIAVSPGSNATLQPCDAATTWRFEPVAPTTTPPPCPPLTDMAASRT